jgi:hypothetical protein
MLSDPTYTLDYPNGMRTIDVTDTTTRLNEALLTATYLPDQDYYGEDEIRVHVSLAEYQGRATADSAAIPVLVAGVNDEPVLIAPGDANGKVSTSEDTEFRIPFLLTDADNKYPSERSEGDLYIAEVAALHGRISLENMPGVAFAHGGKERGYHRYCCSAIYDTGGRGPATAPPLRKFSTIPPRDGRRLCGDVSKRWSRLSGRWGACSLGSCTRLTKTGTRAPPARWTT